MVLRAWHAVIITASMAAAGVAQAAVPHDPAVTPAPAPVLAQGAPLGAAALAGLSGLSGATSPTAAGERLAARRHYRGPRRGWRHRHLRGRPYARRFNRRYGPRRYGPRRYGPRRIYRGPRVIVAPPIHYGYRAPCVERVVRVRPNGAVVRVVRPCRGYRPYW